MASCERWHTIVVGAISLYLFIQRQLKLEEPILEFRVFKYLVFTLATGLGMIVFASMIATTVILPIFMQNLLGFNAFHSGLMLLPGAIVMGIMNPVTGTLFDKYGAKWLLRAGFFILTVTTFMFANLSEETSFTYLAVLNAVRMLGIAMVMMPSTTLAVESVAKSPNSSRNRHEQYVPSDFWCSWDCGSRRYHGNSGDR